MGCWRGERRGNGRKLCMILGGAALRAAPSDAGRPIPVAMTYGTLAPAPALSPPQQRISLSLKQHPHLPSCRTRVLRKSDKLRRTRAGRREGPGVSHVVTLPVSSKFRTIPYISHRQGQFADLWFTKLQASCHSRGPRKTVVLPRQLNGPSPRSHLAISIMRTPSIEYSSCLVLAIRTFG